MKSFHQKVYLIRHGQTEWSKSKKHTGLTDIPLTDEGKKQAEWLKEKLAGIKFKKVFCSPLDRAKQTCKIAGFLDVAEIDEDLYEWDYGDYEGKTTAEIKETNHKWNLFHDGAPNGESVGDVSSRTEHVLSKVRSISGDVAIFSSGHFLRSLGAKWLHLRVTQGELFSFSTASVSILGYERETPIFVGWNCTKN